MGRFKLIILFLMSAFCLVGNAQIRMSETVEIAKDRRIAEHKVLGVLWDTPSLWYSPSDTLYYLHFGVPDDSSSRRINASVKFYLGRTLSIATESISAMIDKLSTIKKDDAFTVEDFTGKKYIIMHWYKHDFYLYDPNMELENVLGKTTAKGVRFCGHIKSLQKLLDKASKLDK